MNIINKIDLSSLRKSEHYQFMYELQNLINKYTPETLGITSEYPLFELTLKKEALASRVEHGSAKSIIIKNLDKKRIRIWRSVKHRIKSAVLSPLSEEVVSGKILQRIFNRYGNLSKGLVTKKSAFMMKLTKEMLEAQNVTHLQVVNLDRLISELEKENRNYITAVNDRNTEIAGRSSRNVGRVRAELDPLYNKITENINAALTLNIAPNEVAEFVSELNYRIKSYKTSIVFRKTMNRKAKKEKKENSAEEQKTLSENLNLPDMETGILAENINPEPI